MKTKISLLTIAVVGGFCTAAFAGGSSVSLSVSCTVPEIPGVNVPYREGQVRVVPPETKQAALVKGADVRNQVQKKLVKTFYPR
jgi:hypothetical protein